MSEVLKRRMRCAVYTRKSTDEGLDQEYNSIDAQRDAIGAGVLRIRNERYLPFWFPKACGPKSPSLPPKMPTWAVERCLPAGKSCIVVKSTGTSTPSASASSCEVPSASIPLLSELSGDCPGPVDMSGAFAGLVTGAFSGVCSGSPKPGGSSDFGSSAPMAGIAEASAAHESAARSQALFAERINRDRFFVPCKWLLRYPVSQEQHCTNNQQNWHQPLYQTSHFDFEYLVICRGCFAPTTAPVYSPPCDEQ